MAHDLKLSRTWQQHKNHNLTHLNTKNIFRKKNIISVLLYISSPASICVTSSFHYCIVNKHEQLWTFLQWRTGKRCVLLLCLAQTGLFTGYFIISPQLWVGQGHNGLSASECKENYFHLLTASVILENVEKWKHKTYKNAQ